MMEIVSNHHYLIPLTGLNLAISFPIISMLTQILNLVFLVETTSLKQNSVIKLVLQITHINACSLLKNLDKLKLIIRNMQTPPSVIGVTETWLNDATSKLVNTKFYFESSDIYIGGGVGIYLQNGLDHKLHPECYFERQQMLLCDGWF